MCMKSSYKVLLFLSLSLSLYCASSVHFDIATSQTSEEQDSVCSPIYIAKTVNSTSRGISEANSLPGFHAVKKFDSNGTLVGVWGTKGTGDGQFLHAHGIGTDSKGNVYVSDAERCDIQKFDSNGTFITKWGSLGTGPSKFLEPESIAVDANGNVFVADYGNHYIQKFDSNGKFITMWGTKGKGKSEFNKAWGVAVNSKGDVYVSDQ